MKLVETKISEIDYGVWASYNIEVDGVVIGEVSINEYDDGAYIERMDIDEQHRNKGLGRQAAEMIASKYDDTYAAPDSEDAQRFWARIGEEVDSDNSYSYLDQGYGVYKF